MSQLGQIRLSRFSPVSPELSSKQCIACENTVPFAIKNSEDHLKVVPEAVLAFGKRAVRVVFSLVIRHLFSRQKSVPCEILLKKSGSIMFLVLHSSIQDSVKIF
jgi:hypothetical protein